MRHRARRSGDRTKLTEHAGIVRGLGPSYSARFEAHGVTFTPALGQRVATPQTVLLTSRSARRGDAPIWQRTANPEALVVGDAVHYRHTNDRTT